jgi:VIT1/CCC1 family predicted Fe2+/Mn2+ transporter
MMKTRIPKEAHRSNRIGWLRAAVLGANDGIVSTASLIVGVAAAHSTQQNILVAGTAGLFAGAMSMAAGEYVSVSSQSDTEHADLARERVELATNIEFEREELASIYESRGLTPELAKEVAIQLMNHDALGSHARDELGIVEGFKARPVQAAIASAASFAFGALFPLIFAMLIANELIIPLVFLGSLISLVLLGVIAARIGGANPWRGALRVGFWGAFAMAATAALGNIFGPIV